MHLARQHSDFLVAMILFVMLKLPLRRPHTLESADIFLELISILASNKTFCEDET